jgi:small subunit ribosomal protein S20
VANKKSAIKRIQIAERNRVRNKTYKSAVRTLIKKSFQASDGLASASGEGAAVAANQALAAAYSKIDKAVKKGVLHANTGARKKSRLAKSFKKASQETVSANT